MSNSNSYHTPVLLKEAIGALNIKKGGKYIDATLGGGGHSEKILEEEGMVLGIDQDKNAIDESKKRFKNKENIKVIKGNFRDIKNLAKENDFYPCSGILVDLGASSKQLKDNDRGFSFSSHKRLDMRMDENTNLDAHKIINKWSRKDLVNIFEKFGEENEAEDIAEKIIEKRETREIIYADELAEIVKNVKKKKNPVIHPATKVFQALRIAVNDELDALKEIILEGVEILENKGRFVIISFHSLEDRIVKMNFLELEKQGIGKVVNKKPIRAEKEELNENRLARSAKMRVFEKK